MKAKAYSSEDFYDRQWEQRQLQSLLVEGQNVLITAPRRVGKTQLTFKLLDWSSQQGWLAVFADVQHAATEADFLVEISRSLKESGVAPGTLDQLKNAADSLRKHLPPSAKWSDGEHSIEVTLSPETEAALKLAQLQLDQLLQTIVENKRQVLVGLDELPIFLTTLANQPDGETRVTGFLNWFRRLRGRPELKSLRWLLSGSIGLDTFVERRGLAGAINDLRPEKLGPFEYEIALQFVKHHARRGARSEEINEATATAIVESVGWPLPYYLRLMVDEIKALPLHKRSAQFPSPQDVSTAYAELISPEKKVQFVHWHSRLEQQFGKVDSRVALAILEQCCKKPAGCIRSSLRTHLIRKHPQAETAELESKLVNTLGILERDGYLLNDGNRWAFRSFLLRDFWLKHIVY